MADNHGNTPAAWTAVAVAMVGFVVGSVALMLSPVNMVLLWIGIALAVISLPLFMVLAKLGLNGAGNTHAGAHDRDRESTPGHAARH
jgi:hypothetical protein